MYCNIFEWFKAFNYHKNNINIIVIFMFCSIKKKLKHKTIKYGFKFLPKETGVLITKIQGGEINFYIK